MLKILAIIIYFWNVENFFAPGEFPGHSWSKTRFYTKCNAVAKTLLLSADELGSLPDIVGFAEVGDASVLKALLGATPLHKLDYSFVHYDSPDRRGIDCALLYRRSRFRLLNSKPCHLYDSIGAVMRTRDILLAVLETKGGARLDSVSGAGFDERSGGRPDTLAVLVNHHPSKVGSASDERRNIAMSRLHFLADSLQAAGISRIIAVGDFNDEVVPAAGVAIGGREGTIKFQGKWEKIDGCPLLEGLRAEERIFAPRCLLERDSYGGEKPRRTFSGPRYLGGISDHLPVIYLISLAPSETTTS
ncbi:MAG: hypothetical protein II891_04300 [Bacteroidales bacterium]|nr:hypothetical protein [Bacteroidales bacterium]